MKSAYKNSGVTFSLSAEEALVLSEMLERLTEDSESSLLPLLESSAEYAVLCRLTNHLETALPGLDAPDYDARLKKARTAIIKAAGKYERIKEKGLV